MSKPKQHEHKESGTMERMGSSQLGRFITRLAVMGALTGAGEAAMANPKCDRAKAAIEQGVPGVTLPPDCLPTAAPAAPAPSGESPKQKKPKPVPPPVPAEKPDGKEDKKEEKKQENKKDGGAKDAGSGEKTANKTETPEEKAIRIQTEKERKAEDAREKLQQDLNKWELLEKEKAQLEEELEKLKENRTANGPTIAAKTKRLGEVNKELNNLQATKASREILKEEIEMKDEEINRIKGKRTAWEKIKDFMGDHFGALFAILGLGGGGVTVKIARGRSMRKKAHEEASRRLRAKQGGATGGGPGGPRQLTGHNSNPQLNP